MLVTTRLSTKQLEALLSSTSALLGAVEAGRFRWLSPAWETLLGTPREILQSRPLLEWVHPEDVAVAEATHRKFGEDAAARVVTYESRIRCGEDSYVWLTWQLSKGDSGDVVYVSAHDITAEKALEARLRKIERMASLGNIAAGAAHEINNPLTYLLANLENLSEEIEQLPVADTLRQPLSQAVEDARSGVDTVRHIVFNLRAFSATQTGELLCIDVKDVLDQAAELTANQVRHRARLVRDYQRVPRVLADGAELMQALVHLLLNAAEALPDGHADTNEIQLRTYVGDHGHVVVEVCDTGPGLPGDQEQLFEPFFTTKSTGQGLGLGLTIAGGIVRGLGGTIHAADRAGGGAVFKVSLPAAPGETLELNSSPGADASEEADEYAPRVLLVDDEELICRTLSRILKKKGYAIRSVNSGRQALEAIESDAPYDVVICDVMMPEMTGAEVYDWLQANQPDVCDRVIFVSGNTFGDETMQFLNDLPNQRLCKPFSVEDLQGTIEDVISFADHAGEL